MGLALVLAMKGTPALLKGFHPTPALHCRVSRIRQGVLFVEGGRGVVR